MADIVLVWHGSLQWGRRQVAEWHFLVDMYMATLDVLERHPDVKMTVQFSGHDIEWFTHERPELTERVKRLMASGQVELALGGYSHNFQGAPPLLNMANLELAQRTCQRVFGQRAAGFWGAESMLNRGLPRALKEAGFSYLFFDSLNVENAGALEYDITGRSYFAGGAFGETIAGLPISRFKGGFSRGAAAGILSYASNPSAFKYDPAPVLALCERAPLIVQVADWEHFNEREGKTQEIHMGTFSIGGLPNRIDQEKIAAWDKILTSVAAAGHTFVTGSAALVKHPPREILQLLDGRDYAKNDLTRLVDACAWHSVRSGGLAGRDEPHHVSDQESYSYSFGGATAYKHLSDLQAPAEVMDARVKDVLISFCSAHRSGGEDFTVKQQLLDRVNRVINAFQRQVKEALPERSILLPRPLPAGWWPIGVRLAGDAPEAIELSGKDAKTIAMVEAAPADNMNLARTHRLWVRGPLPAGVYSLGNAVKPQEAMLDVAVGDDEIVVRRGEDILAFDRWRACRINAWRVDGFAPFREIGGVRLQSLWQEGPLEDEVRGEVVWRHCAGGVEIVCTFQLADVTMARRWRIGDDLRVVQGDTRSLQRRFSYLAPLKYELNGAECGGGDWLMVAEGYNAIACEPLPQAHHVHHLGSELVGMRGKRGLAGMAVNRLSSSPILRREPLTGRLVLMESRPLAAADIAIAYNFAQPPLCETTFRLASGEGEETFAAWQQFYDHPPVCSHDITPLRASDLEWTRDIAPIESVNPHF